MALFDGYLLCTDCDRTLTDKHGNISEKNQEAIRFFQQNGGRCTAATGRKPEHMNWYMEQGMFHPNAPVIAIGGAMIFDCDRQQVIRQTPMARDTLPLALHLFLLDDSLGDFVVYTDRQTICLKRGEDPAKLHLNEEEAVFKYTFTNREDLPLSDKLRKQMRNLTKDDFIFERSSYRTVEMLDRRSGKGGGALFLKEYLPHIHTLACIGDNENDISMIRIADFGFAVENASNECKAVAAHIVPDFEHNPFVKVMEVLKADAQKNHPENCV